MNTRLLTHKPRSAKYTAIVPNAIRVHGPTFHHWAPRSRREPNTTTLLLGDATFVTRSPMGRFI
jgi:hypothetical protein